MFDIYKRLTKGKKDKDMYVFVSCGKKILGHTRIADIKALKSFVLSFANFDKKTVLKVEYSNTIMSDALGCDVMEIEIKTVVL